MHIRVGIFLSTSPIIVLAWAKEEPEYDRAGQIGVLTTCRFDTLEKFFSRVNNLVGNDNARE